MILTVGTYRRALVGALTLLLVGATAPPSNNQMFTLPPPTPGPVKLSDTITFRGPSCSLVSAADDSDSTRLEARGGAMRCVIRISGNFISVGVPGDPDESIGFTYALGPVRSRLTGSGTEDSRVGNTNPVTVTGTIAGVLGSPTGSGTLRVWEPVRSP